MSGEEPSEKRSKVPVKLGYWKIRGVRHNYIQTHDPGIYASREDVVSTYFCVSMLFCCVVGSESSPAAQVCRN